MLDTPSPRSDPWAILGGLRFFLATVVFAFHATSIDFSNTAFSLLGEFGGFSAVVAFFIVSGYSIRASIDRESVHFYRRRFWRIYPVYFVCLIATLSPFWIYGPHIPWQGATLDFPSSIWHWILSFAMLQGFVVPVIKCNPPIWSLAIECAFYLLAPLFQKVSDRIILTVMMLSTALYLLHVAGRLPATTILDRGYINLLLCPALLWAWLAGWVYHPNRDKGWADIMLLLPVPFLVCLQPDGIARFGATTIVMTALALKYGRRIILQPMAAKLLNYAGEISYPLYLCHGIVMLLLLPALLYDHKNSFLSHHTALAVICWYILSIFLSMLLYHAIDQPARNYGGRTRRGRPAASTGNQSSDFT